MPLRILVTGSRHWDDRATIADALTDALEDHRALGTPVLIHGGAPGADALAGEVWRDWIQYGLDLLPPEVHRADWERHGRRAGPIRNAAMVALGAGICLAFPIGTSPGTRGCITLARKAGIPVRVYEGTTT